jgi:hypothetical protein
MSRWDITYKGKEYRFPNFTDTLNNTLPLRQRWFGDGDGGTVLEAELEKTCQLIGDRKKDFSDKEKTQFTNFLLNERGIFGGTGTSEWDEFKNSTAQITVAFNQSILAGDFTDIETYLDEISSWLNQIKSSLESNVEKIVVFKNNDQTGCGNGRCREKACHTTEFWETTKAYYDDMLVQVTEQLVYVASVKSTINEIEAGTLNTGALNSTVANNALQNAEAKLNQEAKEKRKKIFMAIGIVAGLVLLIYVIRKIRNR